ncbi:DUF4397 domain-containing protein [Chitinimonas sp.]|uniref:DUF4397 domain-containing protein n=1 Tax=Chitinimonas sp. TaxID=1934313 RepID=UPI0035AEEC8E
MQLMGGSALLLGSGASLTGCESKKDGVIRPYLRFISLLPDQDALATTLSVASSFPALGFQKNTGFQQIDWAGSYSVNVTNAAKASVASFLLQSVAQKSRNTVYLLPTNAGNSGLLVADETFSINGGKSVIRTFTASSVLGLFDVYLTGPNDDIATRTPTVVGTPNSALSRPAPEIASGSYRVRLTTTNTKNVMFDGTVAFDSQAAYTMVMYSVGSAQLPTLMLVRPDSEVVQVIPSNAARVRVVQGAVPAAAGIASAIGLDGKATGIALPFGNVSEYQMVAPGAHSLTLSVNGGEYAKWSGNFQAGRDYTVYFSGTQGAASSFVVEDNGLPVTTGRAKVRFINASSDQSADVLVNFLPKVAALAPGKDAVLDVDLPSTPVSFVAAGSLRELASFGNTGVAVVANGAYSVALLGGGGRYMAVAFKTN